MEYSREDKKGLCRKYNKNLSEGKDVFEGFSLRDKIALAEFQVEILNRDLDTYKRWESMLIEFRKEVMSGDILNKGGDINEI